MEYHASSFPPLMLPLRCYALLPWQKAKEMNLAQGRDDFSRKPEHLNQGFSGLAVLCIVSWPGATLTSPYYRCQQPPSLTKGENQIAQMSPGKDSHSWLRTTDLQKHPGGTSLVVQGQDVTFQWRGAGSIHGRGAEIPPASWPKHQSVTQKQYGNKFNKDSKNGPHKKIYKKKYKHRGKGRSLPINHSRKERQLFTQSPA